MGIEVDGANQKVVLDADGDTYLEAATDDTLKVYVSGAQDFTITANTLTAESGSTIAAQALTATTVTASGIVKTDDATEATSTTDGSLQTDGGLSVVKDAVFGDDIKLLSDASVIHFGANSEVTLTHSHDSGILLKHTATADDKPINLVLQTGETDMAANDVIGKISFQAPDEGTGTDAILVSGAIQAVAEGDHSSSSNATRLEFMTGASEAATAKMSISSGGIVGIGAVPTGDLGVGLHIKTADSGASASANADELVIEGASSDNTGISILSATDGTANINFGDSGDNDIGRIYYNHGSNYLALYTSGTEHLRIDSAGHVTMPLQPCFLALNDGGDTVNNAADTTIPLDTEAFDLNGDVSSNTFTAPVTGKYFINGAINLDAGSSSNTRFQNVIVMLTCSNRKLKFGYNTVYTNEDDHMQLSGSGVIDMDANDTCVLQVFVSRHGASGATTTVGSSTDLRSGLGGYLVA